MEPEDRMRNTTLEELEAIIEKAEFHMPESQVDRWNNMYQNSLYDRSAFEYIGMPEAYTGTETGHIKPLALARLRVMALYQLDPLSKYDRRPDGAVIIPIQDYQEKK